MYKLTITFLIILLIPTMLVSQDRQMKNLFADYANEQGFDLDKGTSDMDINISKANDFTKLLNNIKGIYVMEINSDEANSKTITKFEKELNNLCNKNNYKTLLDISSDGVFKMLIKRDKNEDPTDIIIINKGGADEMYLWATK